jgi:DNA-binding LacI/PurR family transcriptional regulator
LQERGYHVLVFLAAHTAGNVDDVLDEILDYQVDGIIAASVALSSDLSNRCHIAGVPTVMFNRSQDDLAISAVTSDNYAGGRKVAEFLIAGGHERIAFMAGWEALQPSETVKRAFVMVCRTPACPFLRVV